MSDTTPYRALSGRMVLVEATTDTTLADHLRRTADAIEAVLLNECLPTESVSHAAVEYEGGDGIWTTLLVIE